MIFVHQLLVVELGRCVLTTVVGFPWTLCFNFWELPESSFLWQLSTLAVIPESFPRISTTRSSLLAPQERTFFGGTGRQCHQCQCECCSGSALWFLGVFSLKPLQWPLSLLWKESSALYANICFTMVPVVFDTMIFLKLLSWKEVSRSNILPLESMSGHWEFVTF